MNISFLLLVLETYITKRCCLGTFFVTFCSFSKIIFFLSLHAGEEGKNTTIEAERNESNLFLLYSSTHISTLKWGEVVSLAASLFIAHKILFRST